MPLVAVPTTTGTGAERTTICVLDVLALKVKTGISHPRLRPTLAVVDPALTLTQPAGVTAAAGMDILCHALESYTARPYTTYEKQPEERVPYCGANPIADMWSRRRCPCSRRLPPAVLHGDDIEARRDGHGRDLRRDRLRQRRGAHPARQRLSHRRPRQGLPPRGLPGRRADGAARHGGVPDGARGVPLDLRSRARRHLRAAELLAPDHGYAEPDALPRVLIALMRDIGIPNGLAAVGYAESDVDDLVEGALKQQRLLATAPREVTEDDAAGILTRSLELW